MDANNPPDWVLRLATEREDVRHRLNKLHMFLASPESQGLDEVDRMLLGFQGMMMENYFSVLDVRYNRFMERGA